jgi:hypothetical protein
VRDRQEEERETTRNITGSTRFQRTSRVQPPPSSDGGDGGDGGGSGAGGGCGQHDPLAQTFVVNEAKDGAMITKVDLYFNTAGTRPILIQMVNTKDGFPAEKIIQQKTIEVADVKVSTDASVPTTVVFDSPIFLSGDVTYAILIKVDQPGCKVFFSDIGESNLGDNRTISRNPLTGTMFLSQNGNTWTPHQTRDIKMTMYRASFTGSVAVMDFKNVRNGFTVLNNNPFETAPNTNKVRVTQRNHGLDVGDKVTIANVASGFYGANSVTNGIPHTEFNKQHTVVGPVTNDTYVIEVNASNVVNGIAGLSSDTVGGGNVQATRNFIADLIQPTLTNIRFAQTSLTYDMNVQNKTGNTFTGYKPVGENVNQIYNEPKIILSKENETASVGYSAQIRATFNTLNDFVSPMIDAQRVSLCCIANRIDNRVETDVNLSTHDDRTAVSADTNVAFSNTNGTITTTNSATRDLFDTLDIGKYITVSNAANTNNNVKYLISNYKNDGTTATITTTPAPGTDEGASNAVTIVQHEKYLHDIAPAGASNLANYVTRRFTLANPSTAIKILYEANRPASCSIDVYYKRITDGTEQKFETIPWVKVETEVSDSADGEATIFTERTHLVEGLAEFSAVAIKIVMKSTNTSFVPKIKNLRVIALAL